MASVIKIQPVKWHGRRFLRTHTPIEHGPERQREKRTDDDTAVSTGEPYPEGNISITSISSLNETLPPPPADRNEGSNVWPESPGSSKFCWFFVVDNFNTRSDVVERGVDSRYNN